MSRADLIPILLGAIVGVVLIVGSALCGAIVAGALA